MDIIRELVGELKALDQHIMTLEARKNEIEKSLGDEEKIIDNLSSLFVEYQSLTREVTLARDLYEKRRKDLLDVKTAREMAEQQILVATLEAATLPDVSRPVRPILPLYTLIAAIAGLLLGVSYAFVVDSYDHTLRSIDQAERYMGLNVIASIPDVRGGIVK